MRVGRMELVAATLLLILAGCGAGDGPLRGPLTNPLEERVTATARALATPEAGTLVVTPVVPPTVAPGSGGAEAATIRALDAMAGLLQGPAADLRVESVTARTWPDTCHGSWQTGRSCAPVETSGWRVVLRDGLGGVHTLDVSTDAMTWVGQFPAEGTLVSSDGTSVRVRTSGGILELKVSRSGPPVLARPGDRVRLAYDLSPRGGSVPVVAWLEPAS
jgi:hypothetical protein